MNSNEDLFRANSIRVLAKMIDTTMLGAIERYLKQAIVDKNAMVASSALVAGAHLINLSPEVIRRWVNEVQEAIHSTCDMVQYHALALLHEIKRHDSIQLGGNARVTNMSSPLAICLLIRYITDTLKGENADRILSTPAGRSAYQFLELSLKHRSDAVIYEAAKSLCSLPSVEDRDLGPAIAVLQLLLSSPKMALRLAAMRTLSAVAMAKPSAVTKCNDDMESLVNDNNRLIATYAITTLLKTGSESSVDRLMKQISSFMNDISDEFKVVVVHAIQELCLKYPLKHRVLVGFLANFLREEGGFEFKKAIVDAIVLLIDAIPETKESSLFHLCEFIEDCEFTALSTQILFLIGSLGPTTQIPARYIRFIYNRLILENAIIRAAAINALAKFAMEVSSLRLSVSVLLRRSLCDEDDEVRDRAMLSLRILGYDIIETPPSENQATTDTIASIFSTPSLPLSTLARILDQSDEMSTIMNDPDLAIDYTSLAKYESQAIKNQQLASGNGPTNNNYGGEMTSGKLNSSASQQIRGIPQLASLGKIIKSSDKIELTESETEYVVECVKHITDDNHILLECSITNTVSDQLLKNVRVSLNSTDATYTTVLSIPIPVLQYNTSAQTWVLLKPEADAVFGSPAQFVAELEFFVLEGEIDEIDPDEEGFAEEYPLEDLEISIADFMIHSKITNFREEWESIPRTQEILQKYALQFRDMSSAIHAIVMYLGMQPVDNTDSVDPSSTQHTIHLAGIYLANVRVFVRAQVQVDPSAGSVLKMAVRSDELDVAQLVSASIK